MTTLLVWATLAIASTSSPRPTPALPDSIGSVRNLIWERRTAEAESLARVLVAAAEHAAPVDSALLADAFDALAQAMVSAHQAKDPEALRNAELAMGIRRRRFGPESPEVAASLTTLGNLALGKDDLATARADHQKALAIREKRFGPEHPECATSLHGLGNVLIDEGNFEEARRTFERALAIRERTLGRDHRLVGSTLNNLVYVDRRLGDVHAARAVIERLIEVREAHLGPHHPIVLECRADLATVLVELGEYATAESLDDKVLSETKALRGPEHPDYADRLLDMGYLRSALGDYPAERDLAERALAILERTRGPDHPDLNYPLSMLSSAAYMMGDCGRARPFVERALAISVKAYGPNDLNTARAQASLGSFLVESGNIEAGRALLEKALATQEASPLGESDLPFTLPGLARVDECSGKRRQALEKLERCVKLYEKSGGPEDRTLAYPLKDLAKFHCRDGDYLAARSCLERALAIRTKAGGDMSRDLPWIWTLLGEISAMTGDTLKALDQAMQADRIGRHQLKVMARSLAEREVLHLASSREPAQDFAITLVQRVPKPEARRQVVDAIFRNRALVLDEIASRNRAVARSSDAEVLRLAANVAAARERLAGLFLRGVDGPANQTTRLIAEADSEKDVAERSLAEKSQAFREEQERSAAGYAAVSQALPSGSAVVSFVRYQHRVGKGVFAAFPTSTDTRCSLARPGQGSPEAVARYLAVVTRPGAEPLFVPLDEAATIDSLIARWRREVIAGLSAPPWQQERSEAACRAIGEPLRRALWDPIVPALAGVERVFMVPEGPICLVDFEALPLGEGYLVERAPLIHYLSAERDLVPTSHTPPRSGLLLVADPDFDASPARAPIALASAAQGENHAPGGAPADFAASSGLPSGTRDGQPFRGRSSACGAFRDVRFERLPATTQESRRVRELWLDHARRTPGGVANQVQTLTGDRASEASFKRMAPGCEVLHVATHGFFIGGECPAPGASAPEEMSVGPGECEPQEMENPLARSGLVLAGANLRGRVGTDADDGLLTAEEIAALDLSSTRWAVLSACETGVGVVRVGEGVFGLRRAFQVAGVGTLLISLWPVRDEPSRAWIERLYEQHFARGSDLGRSVREARLDLLKARRVQRKSTHPSFWAGLVASGDWK